MACRAKESGKAPTAAQKWTVTGMADFTMRYDVPIHPISIGSIIKYNVREYGYFYGDGQEKRAINITKIGKVLNIIEHNGRVVYYSVAPSSNCTFNQYFVCDCPDSVWPENVEGVYYDN